MQLPSEYYKLNCANISSYFSSYFAVILSCFCCNLCFGEGPVWKDTEPK